MDINKVCKQIAEDLNEDQEVVKNIVTHQFQFVVDVMKDEDDTKDILISKLFRFKLKKRFKDNKQNNLSPYEKDS